MATRNVNLTPALDQFVEHQVRTGVFQNASEVVRAGLRLLEREAEEHQLKLARLRVEIRVGLDQLDRGEGIEVTDVKAWLDGLGRKRDPLDSD
jgi:antitoxin ParD1/3/4